VTLVAEARWPRVQGTQGSTWELWGEMVDHILARYTWGHNAWKNSFERYTDAALVPTDFGSHPHQVSGAPDDCLPQARQRSGLEPPSGRCVFNMIWPMGLTPHLQAQGPQHLPRAASKSAILQNDTKPTRGREFFSCRALLEFQTDEPHSK